MELIHRIYSGVGPALLVIDVQRAIDDPKWSVHGPRNNPRAEIVIAGLLVEWRRCGMPVVHIRHDSRETLSPYRPGQEGHNFKPEVAPVPGESIVSKQTPNAFIGTRLEALLREAGISSLVVTGVITNNSIEATVRMAGCLGFQAYIVADACFTFPAPDWNGRLRSADEVHAMSLANMHGEYGTVIMGADARSLLKNLV
jgi:nicotinamidase-related amidase